MLAELFGKKSLQYLARYVRANVLMERTHVCEGKTRMKLVKSGF